MAIFRSSVAYPVLQRHSLQPGGPASSDGGSSSDVTTHMIASAPPDGTAPGAAAQPRYAIGAVAVFAVACLLSTILLGSPGGPSFAPAEGVGALALFYVVAQSAERFTELLLPLVRFDGLNKKKTIEKRDAAVAAAINDPTQAKALAAAESQALKDQTVANRRIVTFGMSGSIAMLTCAYLNTDFLSAVGVTFPTTGGQLFPELVRLLTTGLVVGGGAAGLHNLISNLGNSNAKSEDPPETGGSA